MSIIPEPSFGGDGTVVPVHVPVGIQMQTGDAGAVIDQNDTIINSHCKLRLCCFTHCSLESVLSLGLDCILEMVVEIMEICFEKLWKWRK